ncbi:hypothetical protein [Candidatus Leptofilum sp.]|uniref:hypothetical protein n=1 Tax=Candidatus Leptofilum sp. TaxID=3241576 RepID=UPI003B5B532A
MLTRLTIGLLLTIPLLCLPKDACSGEVADRYLAMAMQGNLSNARSLFATAGHLDLVDRQLFENFERRFPTGSDDVEPSRHRSGDTPFEDEMIRLYEHYWRRSLLGQWNPDTGDQWLRQRVSGLVARRYPHIPITGHQDILGLAASKLSDSGLYASVTRTGALQDLLVWRTEERKEFSVELTDGGMALTTVMIDDLESQGWRDFATFGAAPTAGWADRDTVYCICWSYQTGSERFRVSFLKHEARHVRDYSLYPDLSAVKLEFRAKLTELAYAQSTMPNLIAGFRSNAADDVDSPHSRANLQVMQALALELNLPLQARAQELDPWPVVRHYDINSAARRILQRDSQQLMDNVRP